MKREAHRCYSWSFQLHLTKHVQVHRGLRTSGHFARPRSQYSQWIVGCVEGASHSPSHTCHILITLLRLVSQIYGGSPESGLNRVSVTYVTPGGRRVPSEYAYLTPEVLARPNLKVITHAHVTCVLFDQSSPTPRATGVEFTVKGRDTFQVKSRKEVVMWCASLAPRSTLQDNLLTLCFIARALCILHRWVNFHPKSSLFLS